MAGPNAATGRVLVVAGSDSGGGAGIQADIKTVTALGGYAATAITAITAQDTTGVHGVIAVPAGFVKRQIEVVLADIGADCLKTGMLFSAEIIDRVADVIEANAVGIPLVVDPVMVAKGGAALLEPSATEALKARLILRATVVTPNVVEAEALGGMAIGSLRDMRSAAAMLLTLGPKAVLLKGAHLSGDTVHDVLVTADDEEVFESLRVVTRHTHGTGCTLASAIATGLAQGMTIRDAVIRARAYVLEAIAGAPGFGAGHGPLAHGHTFTSFTAAATATAAIKP